MPFQNTALTPLLTGSGFTLWLYRTADTRATALGADYFTPAAARLATGDLILLQAADAIGLLPVRAGDVVGAGLVIDTSPAPFRVNRAAGQRFSVRQVASAVVMTVLLAPLAAGITSNGMVQGQATVTGPVAQVTFSIRDANGATVRGPQAASVSGGSASVTFPSPAIGTGYRMRVEAAGFPEVADTSQPFTVSPPYALLLQSGDTLLLEDGGRVLL